MNIVSSSDGNRPVKAIRKIVEIGAGIEVEGFMQPGGSYRLSKTSAALAIGKPRNSVVVTLRRKTPEALALKGQFDVVKICVEGNNGLIDAISLETTALYWQYWAAKGHPPAQAIIAAATAEVLTRRFDLAFGMKRTEEDYMTRFNRVFNEIREWHEEYNRLITEKALSAIEPLENEIQAYLDMNKSDEWTDRKILPLSRKIDRINNIWGKEKEFFTRLGFQAGCFLTGDASKQEFQSWVNLYTTECEQEGYSQPCRQLLEKYRDLLK